MFMDFSLFRKLLKPIELVLFKHRYVPILKNQDTKPHTYETDNLLFKLVLAKLLFILKLFSNMGEILQDLALGNDLLLLLLLLLRSQKHKKENF
jgi:hypothetical protein